MSEQHVLTSRDGPVAAVTLNRPDVHNAFNEHVIAQLQQAFQTLGAADDVRLVILRSEGPSFSAGADLDWMHRAANFSQEENFRDAKAAAALWRSVAECPKPVVARVHGNAFGGGAGLVAASDIAVAAEGAMFGFTEVRLGLVPATVAPHVIEKIGPGRALPLFLTGDRFDARTAKTIGLVHRVVPADELDASVDSVIKSLLAGSPNALSACKELVRRIQSEHRTNIDAYTADLIASTRAGAEGREGVAAFLEKREATWRERPH